MGKDPLDLNSLITKSRRDRVIAEKQNLQPGQHDWQVIVAYAITDAEARGDGPVPLEQETVAGAVGPVCGKCQLLLEMVGDTPCGTDAYTTNSGVEVEQPPIPGV